MLVNVFSSMRPLAEYLYYSVDNIAIAAAPPKLLALTNSGRWSLFDSYTPFYRIAEASLTISS